MRRYMGKKIKHSPKLFGILIRFLLIILIVIALFYFVNKKSDQHKSIETINSISENEDSQIENTGVVAKNINQWNLVLVNPWNSIEGELDLNLKMLANGHSVDERCYEQLQEMIDDCRQAGLKPVICASYRTKQKQEELFKSKIELLMDSGYTQEEAEKTAATIVATPGTSEHQIGLAVDIVDINHQVLDTTQEDTQVQKWLMENSWKYGFILRYPNGKSEITGIIYEPWHYRYVGKEDAKQIKELDVCLEEYLSILELKTTKP